MEISDNGIALLKKLEGFRATLYDDAGHQAIGYGCDLTPEEAAFYAGVTITEANAEILLRLRLRSCVGAVNAFVTVPLNQNQFDALCSFTYNVGRMAFKLSTLLLHLNRGDFVGAAQEFLRWNHVNGVVNIGLAKRRQAERYLFLAPVTSAVATMDLEPAS